MEHTVQHPESARTNRFAFVAAAVLVPYLLLVQRFAFVCDDAYISFRYARHLARGVGLRFNAGELPPVEGYSNLLWILWLAPFELAAPGSLPRVAMISSALLGALLLVLVLRLAERRLRLSAAQLLSTGVVLVTLPPFFVWSTSGLETMACACAVFLVFERLSLDPERPRVLAAGLAACAAVLTRADGALFVAAALGASVIAAPEPGRALAAAVRTGLFALAAVLAQLAFRVGYHGAWVPHTAHVKAGLSSVRLERGFGYVASLLLELPSLLLVPLAAAAWVRTRGRMALAALSFLLFALAYSILVGGDFMAMGRFLVPAMAFAALSFAVLGRGLGDGGRLVLCTVLVVASGLASGFDGAPVPASLRQRVHFRWNAPRARSEASQWRGMRARARSWVRLGKALAVHTQPGESIVLTNLGAIGYFTELHAFDQFGLVSPEVAVSQPVLTRASPGHDRLVPPSFFFDQEPDYLEAWISPASAPAGDRLSPQTGALLSAGRARLERRGPAAGDGLGRGEELRLVRLVWDE